MVLCVDIVEGLWTYGIYSLFRFDILSMLYYMLYYMDIIIIVVEHKQYLYHTYYLCSKYVKLAHIHTSYISNICLIT